MGLKWEDIDLDRGMFRIRRTLSGLRGGTPVFGTPKTAKGRRGVKLTGRAVEAIEEYRTCQQEEREELAGLWQAHGLVFCTRVGTAVSRHNLVNRSFKPLLERAGLPEIRFHDLRHTCTTPLLIVAPTPRWSKRRWDTPTSPSPGTSTRTSCPTCRRKWYGRWTTCSPERAEVLLR